MGSPSFCSLQGVRKGTVYWKWCLMEAGKSGGERNSPVWISGLFSWFSVLDWSVYKRVVSVIRIHRRGDALLKSVSAFLPRDTLRDMCGLLIHCYLDPATCSPATLSPWAGYLTIYCVSYFPHLKMGHEQDLTQRVTVRIKWENPGKAIRAVPPYTSLQYTPALFCYYYFYYEEHTCGTFYMLWWD